MQNLHMTAGTSGCAQAQLTTVVLTFSTLLSLAVQAMDPCDQKPKNTKTDTPDRQPEFTQTAGLNSSSTVTHNGQKAISRLAHLTDLQTCQGLHSHSQAIRKGLQSYYTPGEESIAAA